MPAEVITPLVAVDIGNTRTKFGLFDSATQDQALPTPRLEYAVPTADGNFSGLTQWLSPLVERDVSWWISSVNRAATTRLVDWLRDRAAPGGMTLLSAADLPLTVRLEHPDRVGIDRLLAAVAAAALRPAGSPQVVVCLGSAITVNLISGAGEFLGGAILPGISMSARAMHDYTDLLPHLPMHELAEAPDSVGSDTVSAMRSGLFWGAIGGVRELISRYQLHAGGQAHVVLTGGAAPSVAPLLSHTASHVPHLILAGIAIAARQSA